MKILNTKQVLLILLIGILTIPLFACAKPNTVVKIGFSYELTGLNSELGRDAMYGALLAVDYINQEGGINGKQVELLIKDDLGDPDVAVQVDNELIAEGCIAIVGHGTSSLAEKVIQNANEQDFIVLSPTISSYEYSDIDDNFFRLIPANDTQGSNVAQFMNSHTPGDVLVFRELGNTAYTQTIAASFIETFQTYDDSIELNDVLTFTTKNEESYLSIVETINTSTVENVFIIGSSYDVSTILQENLRDDVKIYIPVWATTLDIFSSSGTFIENTHGINYFDLTSIEPNFVKFLHDYEETYGNEPSFSSMFSYESIMTLATALSNISDYTTANIKSALLNLGTQNYLIDDITFNQYGDCTRKVYWYHLINGEFIEVN